MSTDKTGLEQSQVQEETCAKQSGILRKHTASTCSLAGATGFAVASLRHNIPASCTSCDDVRLAPATEADACHHAEACGSSVRATCSPEQAQELVLRPPSGIHEPKVRVGADKRYVVETHRPGAMAQGSSPSTLWSSQVRFGEAPVQGGSSCAKAAKVGCAETTCDSVRSPNGSAEILAHVEEDHMERTLVVRGIGVLGIDAIGILRTYFSQFGKVELVIEPSLDRAQGLAIVRVEDVETIRDVMAFGGSHSIGGRELTVQRIGAL
eukprot:TRINITY_DN26938_c0_g1_i1.p1 TRINITY_DN26938_c0_g1~~TRINITY_DN26938_c0_g1_i1.p1  ORF type:complete len:266 (+),score=24.45 TRINITY_DN26938_c0_g1_i1:74-871(+)